MIENYIGIMAGGGFRSLIDGAEFPATTKAEKVAAQQACRAHVAALCDAQGGGMERTLEDRQQQYRDEPPIQPPYISVLV